MSILINLIKKLQYILGHMPSSENILSELIFSAQNASLHKKMAHMQKKKNSLPLLVQHCVD